jgi:hypothetical protein
MSLRLRRGTDSTRTSITPVQGEPIYTTDTKKLYIGDGTTAGGIEIGGGASVSASGNNRVITSDGTATGLNGELNLTFDGSTLIVVGNVTANSFTGSLQGTATTASFVLQAVSSSFATNSSTASFLSGTVDSITFTTTSGISVGVGELAWNNSDGTLDLGMKGGNVVQQIGQEIFCVVRNDTGDVIENGTAVYALGVTVGSGRIIASPFTADGSVREVRFLGLATEDINNGVNGFVTNFGYVRGLDTRGTEETAISVGDEDWQVGDVLYAHPTVAGKLTNIPPKHKIYVAILIVRHQNVGVLFVRPSSYGHIDDIHDVSISTGSLSSGDLLVYDASSDDWKNSKQLTGSYGITGSLQATSFTGSLQGTATTASFASTASSVNTLIQDVTVSGSIFLSGSLNTPVFIDYEERFTSPAISAGTLTLNLADGNVFDVALNAAITTLTISNPPASNNAGSFVLVFTADGTPRAVTWGASILWPGGIAPTLTSTNGKKDVFGFISLNSGTNFMGFIGGQNI